jgi:hypothetical protein
MMPVKTSADPNEVVRVEAVRLAAPYSHSSGASASSQQPAAASGGGRCHTASAVGRARSMGYLKIPLATRRELLHCG